MPQRVNCLSGSGPQSSPGVSLDTTARVSERCCAVEVDKLAEELQISSKRIQEQGAVAAPTQPSRVLGMHGSLHVTHRPDVACNVSRTVLSLCVEQWSGPITKVGDERCAGGEGDGNRTLLGGRRAASGRGSWFVGVVCRRAGASLPGSGRRRGAGALHATSFSVARRVEVMPAPTPPQACGCSSSRSCASSCRRTSRKPPREVRSAGRLRRGVVPSCWQQRAQDSHS